MNYLINDKVWSTLQPEENHLVTEKGLATQETISSQIIFSNPTNPIL